MRRSRASSASPTTAQASASAERSPLPRGGEPEPVALDEHEAQAGCDFADHGFGVYERWRPLPLGKLLVPPAHAIRADGGYDLLIHFHGAEPVRKLLAPKGMDLVIAGVDLGTRSSEYARALESGGWDALLQAIDREVGSATGSAGAHARRLVLSSWSAGSGAIGRIIERGNSHVDGLILLDSLYGSYMPGQTSLAQGQLAPYVALASAAARGAPVFYLTHTEIPTSGYASTKETATFLLRELGAAPIAVTASGDDAPSGAPGRGAEEAEAGGALRLTRMYDGGSLYVRGYAGAGPGEHCAQLRLLPAILAEHVLPALHR
ncbi:hypothetical protein [Sorangium sp. So ce1000]|uniref:hypothetical protein n=1 Tax=Sorangium sp. So ce1000 TaxID=3133325 RepID=UPI003F5E4D65